ncbi:MAG TPA: DUF2269 family protein [Gaiellaceae bacterium]
MSKYDWLLFLHVTGAFCVLGGAVMAGVFNIAALRRERPSEIALLFRLTRVAVVAIGLGMGLTLVFGLWLVHYRGYGWSQTWIVLALVFWTLSNALGGIGGGREKRLRQLAERLASEGDAPSPELSGQLRDVRWLALNWTSGLLIVTIVALMVWKPGT